MNIFVGVDPGKSGGFSILYCDDKKTVAESYPWDDQAFVRKMR